MKISKKFLLVFLVSIFFIPKIYASENTIYGSFPNIPSDAKNYFISYDANFKVFNNL